MKVYLNDSVKSLEKLINNVKQEHPESSIRIALVGYRDFTLQDHFEHFDFTQLSKILRGWF